MKNHGLLFMGLATLLFAACNNNSQDIEGESSKSKEPALLSISLAGAGNVTGKAAGTPTANEESQVNDGIIYVFDNRGDIVDKAFFKAGDITSSSGSKQVATTTAAASVSVLLNTGISDSALIVGTPFDVASKTQLQALTVDLATSSGTGAGNQVKGNLLMSGSTSDPITFTGTPKTANISVVVSRIVSKITINWSFEPNSALTNKIRLVGAIVLNAPLSSRLFGSSLTLSNAMYLEALPDAVLNAFPFEGYRPADGHMISNIDLLSVSNFAVSPVPENHFYVFENTNEFPTIVAIVADFNENGIDLPAPGNNFRKYYPIVINKASTGGQDGSMAIKRNTTYNVKATVKGIGVDNPFNPIDPASLNVTVTVADWALIVNVEQTFD